MSVEGRKRGKEGEKRGSGQPARNSLLDRASPVRPACPLSLSACPALFHLSFHRFSSASFASPALPPSLVLAVCRIRHFLLFPLLLLLFLFLVFISIHPLCCGCS